MVMREFGVVLQQAGGIVVGLGFVGIGGYLLWLVLTENIKSPTWRRLLWTIGQILLLIIVLRFIAPRQATALYQTGRDWWINVPSRDIGILWRNLVTALGGGSSDSSDYRPLEELSPQIPTDPAGASQGSGYVQPQQLVPGAAMGNGMVGGAVLPTCVDSDCPGGQCPQGCRAAYTWVHNSIRYGRICNATGPNEAFGWLRIDLGSPDWANAPPCPSIR